MQILKGEILKSLTVEAILKSTKSLCFVYYDHQLPFENYYSIDSKSYSINQLQEYLLEFFSVPRFDSDYVIIYTNKVEEEILDFIKWLGENEFKFNTRCILITCR